MAQQQTRLVAEFTGKANFDVRHISAKDQNALVGTPVTKKALEWNAGNNWKLDVTDVHPDVVSYLRDEDELFNVHEVAVEVDDDKK